MNEDAEAYKNRLYSYLGTEEPIDVMSRTADRLQNLLLGDVAAEIQRKPSPDRWSRAEILAHFAEGEIVLAYRLRMIARDPGCAIQAYDQNVWVQNASYLAEHPDQALNLFRAARNANVAFVKSLPEEAWDSYGLHSERGKETIRDLIRLAAGHDINHLKQLGV